MKVTSNHHDAAETAFADGKKTIDVQVMLRGSPHNLTPSQASDCCRTARKHLGIYKSKKSEAAERAKIAKIEADKQAKRKTEVSNG